MPPTESASNSWLIYVLLTVASWGVYGIFLHKGQIDMVPEGMKDPNARYKAFLFVGIAYFLVAVLAPIVVLLINSATWKFTGPGMTWSLIAGIVGAIGAFGVLLAFGGGGKPAVVMSLIFAGAPIVNALVAITLDKQWSNIKPQFIAGIVIAAIGAYMVVVYKPVHAKHPHPITPETTHAAPDSPDRT